MWPTSLAYMQTPLAVQNSFRDSTTELCNTALQAERGGQKPGLALHSLTNLLPLLVPSYLPLRFLTGCLNNLGSSQLHSSRNSTADPQEFMQRPFHLHLAVLGPGFPPARGHQTSPQILGLLGLQPALLSSQKTARPCRRKPFSCPGRRKQSCFLLGTTAHHCSGVFCTSHKRWP